MTTTKGYLAGLILGDGHIDKGVHKRAFRIKSINLDFIDDIENYLNKNTNFRVMVQFKGSNKNGVNQKHYKELTIKSHPYFAKCYRVFYDDYRNRIITRQALNALDLSGLANWYMSDGYVVKVGLTKGKITDRRVELSLDKYRLKDIEQLKKYLYQTYGYETRIIKRKKGLYRLRMKLSSAQQFFLDIYPYISDSFLYKLNLAYDDQPKWVSDEYYNLMCELQNAKRLTNPYC